MTAAALTDQRRHELAAFYADQRRQLIQQVRRRVYGTSAAVIADACGHAWLQLVTHPYVRLDREGLAWLTQTAVREAWRLAGAARQEPAAGLFHAERTQRGEDELGDPPGPASDPLDRAIAGEQHHARVDRFAQLKPRERRDLLLQASGYSYHEIAALTGSTYTAINRRLAEGRVRLRNADGGRDSASGDL